MSYEPGASSPSLARVCAWPPRAASMSGVAPTRECLALLQPLIETMTVRPLKCRGYIFFGSTLQLMDEVYRSIVLSPEAVRQYPHGLGDRGAAKRREMSAAAGISCASSSSSLEKAFVSPRESGSRPRRARQKA